MWGEERFSEVSWATKLAHNVELILHSDLVTWMHIIVLPFICVFMALEMS
jgi:hypothetical protein